MQKANRRTNRNKTIIATQHRNKNRKTNAKSTNINKITCTHLVTILAPKTAGNTPHSTLLRKRNSMQLPAVSRKLEAAFRHLNMPRTLPTNFSRYSPPHPPRRATGINEAQLLAAVRFAPSCFPSSGLNLVDMTG